MKSMINEFLNSLISYDYILFGIIVLVFILLVVFIIVFRHKRVLFVFLVILAMLTLAVFPFVGYSIMHVYNLLSLVDKWFPPCLTATYLLRIDDFSNSRCKIVDARLIS